VQVTADYVDHRLATFPLTFQELAESCDLTKCAQASPQHALYLMGFHGLCTRHWRPVGTSALCCWYWRSEKEYTRM